MAERAARQSQIFLSFSRQDNLFVEKLRDALTQAGFNLWVADDDLLIGTDWSDAIEKALRDSVAMIVVLSPPAIQSEWVRKEYGYFLVSKKPLLPIMAARTELPFDLQRIQYLDFTNGINERNLSQLTRALRSLLDSLEGVSQEQAVVEPPRKGRQEQTVQQPRTVVNAPVAKTSKRRQTEVQADSSEALVSEAPVSEAPTEAPVSKPPASEARTSSSEGAPPSFEEPESTNSASPPAQTSTPAQTADADTETAKTTPPLQTKTGTAPPPPPNSPPAAPPDAPPDQSSGDDASKERDDSRYRVIRSALSDEPTDDDLLGFDNYARAIAEFILHPRTDKPLTISINAAWGVGKSSLMKMIRRELHIQTRETRLRPVTNVLVSIGEAAGNSPLLGRIARTGVGQRFVALMNVLLFPLISPREYAAQKPFNLFRFVGNFGFVKAVTATPLAASIASTMRFFLSPIIKLDMKPRGKRVVHSPLNTVWFNAWKYDDEEALWAALSLLVIHECVDRAPFLRRLWFKFRLNGFDFRRLLIDLLKALVTLIVVAGAGFAVFLVLGALQGDALGDLVQKALVSLLTGGGVALYQLGASFLSSSKNLLNLHLEQYSRAKPDYAKRVGFLAEFENDFRRIVRVVTYGGRHPLVIFIDDLDRCSIPKAADLIEAINLFLNMDDCVFVIGMDVRTVAASIEARYEKLKSLLIDDADGKEPVLGQHFLEKIVQITFPIPQPNPAALKKFVESTLHGQVATRSAVAAAEAQKVIARRDLEAKVGENPSLQNIASAANELDLSKVVADSSESEQEQEAERERYRRQVAGETILANFDDLPEVLEDVYALFGFLGYNPRRVKRFINVFRLQAAIAVQHGALTDRSQLESLKTWFVIAFRWPQFITYMIDAPSFDNRLFDASRINARLTEKGILKKDRDALQKTLDQHLTDRGIAELLGEKELIALLPETQALGDDAVVPVLVPVVQIARSVMVDHQRKPADADKSAAATRADAREAQVKMARANARRRNQSQQTKN